MSTKRVDLDALHRDVVEKKKQRIDGLEWLIEIWQERDPDYARELRAKLRRAKVQLEAMRP